MRWVLLDSYGYGTCTWEENSLLYWCGGDAYAIVFDRNAVGAPRQEMVSVIKGSQVNEAWENELASYNYYS